MMTSTQYSSNDGQYTIVYANEMIDQLIIHITEAGKNETGGVIMGQYNELRNCATMGFITGPPPDSKRGRTWFERGVKGLSELVKQSWKKKQYYLGEWHFHPYALPTPSGTDNNQMEKIAASKQYCCPEPILLIIAGNPQIYEIRIFVFLSGRRVVELFRCN